MDQKKTYNQMWKRGNVQNPKAWSLWKIVKDFQGKINLEIGPGNYPKIPIKNGFFLDISENAIKNLKKLGANAQVGNITNLPFQNNFFDLIVAIEVLEHIENDEKALKEIFRVLKPNGYFLFSVPLKPELYNEFDKAVGHYRRYKIQELQSQISNAGFLVVKYRCHSIYLKITESLARRAHLKNLLFQNKKHIDISHAPKSFIDFYSRLLAFLDKKGAPEWQVNIENLAQYPDKAITIFCRKI